jgi:hypothetical protein
MGCLFLVLVNERSCLGYISNYMDRNGLVIIQILILFRCEFMNIIVNRLTITVI